MAELPAPLLREREMEAAKAWGYRWSDWLAESPVLRGEMMAHETLQNLRTGYLSERARLSAERESKGKGAPSAAARGIMSSFGL